MGRGCFVLAKGFLVGAGGICGSNAQPWCAGQRRRMVGGRLHTAWEQRRAVDRSRRMISFQVSTKNRQFHLQNVAPRPH